MFGNARLIETRCLRSAHARLLSGSGLARDLRHARRPLQQIGADTGTAYTLPDCQSKPFYTRDARGVELLVSDDALRRPMQAAAPPTRRARSTYVAEKMVYGDDPTAPADATANLLGRVYQYFDQAGIVTSARYDFKGNLLTSDRQLIAALQSPPDWSETYLEPFHHHAQYDALAARSASILPRRKSRGTDNVIAREYRGRDRCRGSRCNCNPAAPRST